MDLQCHHLSLPTFQILVQLGNVFVLLAVFSTTLVNQVMFMEPQSVLTLYQINIALKAFSLEQEPQAIV